MRLLAMVPMVAFVVTASAVAQTRGAGTPPAEIGNRSNGLSYQPTPNEVDGREAAKGIRPPAAEQRATDRRLEKTDKQLLREEGLESDSNRSCNVLALKSSKFAPFRRLTPGRAAATSA